MKINSPALLRICFLAVVVVYLQPALAQQQKISIQINSSENQVAYAANQIKKAAAAKKYTVQFSSAVSNTSNDGVTIKKNQKKKQSAMPAIFCRK